MLPKHICSESAQWTRNWLNKYVFERDYLRVYTVQAYNVCNCDKIYVGIGIGTYEMEINVNKTMNGSIKFLIETNGYYHFALNVYNRIKSIRIVWYFQIAKKIASN